MPQAFAWDYGSVLLTLTDGEPKAMDICRPHWESLLREERNRLL